MDTFKVIVKKENYMMDTKEMMKDKKNLKALTKFVRTLFLMRFSGMLSLVEICSEVTNLHDTDSWMWDLICVVPSQVEQFTFPLACKRVIVECGWPLFLVVLDPVIESVRKIVLKTS